MTTKVYLWLGIETQAEKWSLANFQTVITFIKAHNMDGAYVKVFDGQMGEWYSWLPGGFASVYTLFTANGLDAIPYGFHYGNAQGSSLVGEASLALKYLNSYGVYCADMEGCWDGQGDWVAQFAAIIAPLHYSKKLYISTWANITEHRWLTGTGELAPVTSAFLPQAYDDYLYNAMLNDWYHLSGVTIWPTFDLSQESGPNNQLNTLKNFFSLYAPDQISLWEWQTAVSNPALVDTLVAIAKKEVHPIILSPQHCVIDITQTNQLNDPSQSQDMCGPMSAAALKYAGLPGHGGGSAANIDSQGDAWYTEYIGPNVPSDQYGSSIDNMHSFFHDAGNIHYWDIDAINSNSVQATDIANIRAAIHAGYAVDVTALEQSVVSKYLGDVCPYPWQPAMGDANHIFPIIGIDTNGDYICADQLNSFEPWPQIYRAQYMGISWASIIQLVGPNVTTPWLAPIPSNTPTTWPVGYNAQRFNVATANANAMKVAVWEAVHPGNPRNSGLWGWWTSEWNAGRNHGSPMSGEIDTTDELGDPCLIMIFPGGIAKWKNGRLDKFTSVV